ncbi:hypothetical protein GGR57DRAFT_499638 [Xylariaceae sp. FL1272]|nr:hypothetical protein GGR57DRAFT_499638 [Xylariaceae sp. FL1272]
MGDSSPFYLFANVNLVPDCYDAWQAAYDDLGRYVFDHEHSTETYYFGIPVEYGSEISKTPHMFAFEDLYTTHLGSSAMQAFLQKVPPLMTTGLDLLHFEKVGGYIDRRNDLSSCAVMKDTRIKAQSASSQEAIVEAMKTLSNKIEQDKECEGVLTFATFKSLDNEVDGRIFARWDTREKMEWFSRRADVLRFWAGIKDHVEQMEWRNYVENGKGWLHR